MTTDPQLSLRAVFTVTVETRKGAAYFDRDGFVLHAVSRIEGALEGSDDIRDVTVVEAASAAVRSAPADDLPARLEAVLTERFTENNNPFSAMRRHEKGPDGWPASHPVGPHQVAEVLRELVAAAPVPPSEPTDRAALVKRVAAALSEHGMVHLNDPDLADEYDCCAEAALDAADDPSRLAVEAPAPNRADDEPDEDPPAPLRRAWDDCPGFPEHCPNLRPVDPDPPVHLGGIRCGCADKETDRA